MEKPKIRLPLTQSQSINLDGSQVTGIVIAICIVLITVGKLIYNRRWIFCMCECVTYGVMVEYIQNVMIGTGIRFYHVHQGLDSFIDFPSFSQIKSCGHV
jgi:hypothetical protein